MEVKSKNFIQIKNLYFIKRKLYKFAYNYEQIDTEIYMWKGNLMILKN